MTKEELLKQHDDGSEEYKQNPPEIIEKLEWKAGEGIVSELPTKDLIQLLSRYLNNDGVYVKNILHLLLRIEKLLTFIATAQGIDVAKEFKKDAERQAELMEAQLKASKEALEKKA